MHEQDQIRPLGRSAVPGLRLAERPCLVNYASSVRLAEVHLLYSVVLQGFQRVADNLEDTALDCPAARSEFPAIVAAAQSAGWLDACFEVCE